MISTKQNALMTRSGQGMPAGKLLRMYWQPAALVDELQGAASGQGRPAARRRSRAVPRLSRGLRADPAQLSAS